MAISVSEIKNLVKIAYNSISDTDFLSLLETIHDRICSRVQLYPGKTVDVKWTAEDVTNGVSEWLLNPDLRRGWQARYHDSATTSFELRPTNIHRLDVTNPDWRTDAAATPEEWYESGGMIGLYPKPSASPSSGYPFVRLYATEREALNADSVLPEQVGMPDAWEYGVKWKYAVDRDPEKAEFYYGLYRMSLKALADDINAINPRDPKEVHVYAPPVVNI